jgi:hypothetical protein
MWEQQWRQSESIARFLLRSAGSVFVIPFLSVSWNEASSKLQIRAASFMLGIFFGMGRRIEGAMNPFSLDSLLLSALARRNTKRQ